MNDSVWTPTRESPGVRAFMATMRLHSTNWQWTEQADQARWWVIDASAGIDLTELLKHHDRMAEKPSVAFLANQLSQLPRPAWTFFKPPVQAGLIFNWIRPHVTTSSAPTQPGPAHDRQPWRHGLLRLRRWPNVSRYGNTLELTVACSRLLAAPASYEEVLGWNVPPAVLDPLLADAHRQGLLQHEPGAAPATTATRDAPIAETAAERSRWDLIKRLLGKFSRS